MKHIKFIVFDFDGVFSDGKFYFDNKNNVKKTYNGKDSYALKLIQKHNIKCGIISKDKIVSIKNAPHIFGRLDKYSLGSEKPKIDILDEWINEYGFSYQEVAYIGDDLPDIEILKKVGFSACPNNAVIDVKKVSQYICKNNSGDGAVREFIDLIIKKNTHHNNICFCIPARLNSSRLNEKLLLYINNKTCIQHTVSQLYSSKYFNNNIFVFTNSKTIKSNLKNYNCNIILTEGTYKNGTERISTNLNLIDEKYNVIVNIQGDEPFISHLNVDYCIEKHIHDTSEKFYTTLHETNNSNEYLKSTASLKVIVDKNDDVIYYSRNIIPFNKTGKINPNITYNTFTGIYVYDKSKILEYIDLDNSFLQNEEDCEQLKLIENGYKIKSYKTLTYNEISLNTKKDYDYLLNKYCKKNTYILDCTLRDGGYINNWMFNDEFIYNYIELMNKLNIDLVEIGFGNFTKIYKNGPVGKSRNIDENYIKLFLNKKFKISILCDYSDINMQLLTNIKDLNMINLVRIAFHKKDMKDAIKKCKEIQVLGYKISVNAMAITNYNEKELDNLINLVNKNNFDIMYIADSYGSLDSNTVRNYLNMFSCKLSNTSIGVHLHNNMNNAFNNYVNSQDTGIDKNLFIDCTLFGMGRGAGNLQTELVLNHRNIDKKKIIMLLKFINKYILKFYNNKSIINWGYNLDYFMSGLFQIHPNYINKFRDINISFDNVILMIENIISDNKESYFDIQYLDNLINKYNDLIVSNN